MRPLTWITLCWLALAAGGALAQERSVSYSTWIIAGNMVTLRYLLPVTVAQRLMGVEVPVLTTEKLEEYLLQHQTVASVSGDCPAIDQGFDLGRVDPLAVGPDLYGFEIFYRCKDPRQASRGSQSSQERRNALGSVRTLGWPCFPIAASVSEVRRTSRSRHRGRSLRRSRTG